MRLLDTVSNPMFWRVTDLTVSYGKALALSSVSIDIRKTGVTGIIGPSGCGKSSFLYCLNLLSEMIPGCCVSGRIEIESEDILADRVDGTLLRRRVGLIFQKPNPFPMSIRRNLELPLREHGVRDPRELDATIERCLVEVGLWDEVKDRLSATALALSGGQQQRLCIARALVLRPDAFLMDEPCSALDPVSTGVVEELIQSLSVNYTIVMVTHNLRQARRLSSDVAFFWIQDGIGKLIESGSSDQIFNAPKNELTQRYVHGHVA